MYTFKSTIPCYQKQKQAAEQLLNKDKEKEEDKTPEEEM